MVMAALERLTPPRIVGEMTLLARLGEGGMATVYLAAAGKGAFARLAAVKLLRPEVADKDYRTRFLDEAKVVVRLHHNNLVDVRAAGEVEGSLYIAMEAIEGRDLADLWDRCAEAGKAFPVPIAVHIAREILRGLHYAHGFPGLALVHRDVSPSNVLVDWAGAVRLADFGLATSTLKVSHTMPGVVFGKVAYMSPEQARGERVDARADVYAVSVVLWELLTGRPFRASDGLDTDAVARAIAVPPSTLSRRVDPELDEIVLRGLQPHPAERWQSAEEMLQALGGWLAEHAPQTGQETVATFLRMLYGALIEVEREDRERLLGDHSGEPRGPDTMFDQRPTASMKAGGDREAIEAGTVVAERYRVTQRLGRGGMGIVYLGEHLRVGRSVAIKVLTHEWSSNADVARRFRAEARAATAAGHPNIVEVFDAGELPDGRLYLVMEFLTGRNLYEEVQAGGPMDVARACHIMRDVARAVRAAHEVGVIHRDLKPDNVMLVDRGRGEGEVVKVLDFGISASGDRAPGEERLTVAGQALGTPEYMAPEQARGEAPSERFDIYALGVIFYELLSGSPPITGNNHIDVMTRKSMQPSPSVGLCREGLPEELVTLIDECLAISPDARPKNARVFLSRLGDALRALPRTPASNDAVGPSPELVTAADPAIVPDPEPEPARGRMVGIGIAAGMLLAGAVTIGIWAVQSQNAAATSRELTTVPQAETPVLPRDEPEEQAEPREPVPQEPVPQEPTAVEPKPTETGKSPAATEVVPAAVESKAAIPTHTPSEPAPSEPSPSEPAASNPDSAECQSARKKAQSAAGDSDWKAVLRFTKDRKCWNVASEAKKLEVRALKELGKWERCVEVGKDHPDPTVRGWVKLCAARLSG